MTHILFFQQRRLRWMHAWNLWGSEPPTRLRTTAVDINRGISDCQVYLNFFFNLLDLLWTLNLIQKREPVSHENHQASREQSKTSLPPPCFLQNGRYRTKKLTFFSKKCTSLNKIHIFSHRFQNEYSKNKKCLYSFWKNFEIHNIFG